MPDQPCAAVRLIHCSDMHLFEQPNGELIGINTYDSFKSVLDLIQQEQA